VKEKLAHFTGVYKTLTTLAKKLQQQQTTEGVAFFLFYVI